MSIPKFSVTAAHYASDPAGRPRLVLHDAASIGEPAQAWAVTSLDSPYALLVFDRDYRGLARLVADKLNEARVLDVIEACLSLGAQYAPDVIERNGVLVGEARAEVLATVRPEHWHAADSTLPCYAPPEGGAPWARCDFESFVRERFGDCMSHAGAPSADFARDVFERCLATGNAPREAAAELALSDLGCESPAVRPAA